MRINFIISTVTQGTDCNNIAYLEIIKNNLLNLWRDNVYSTPKNYIIGVENGIAKVQYPNTPENRIHVASMGYDIISVTKEEANRLWKSSVLVITEKLDLKEIANEIKQI